jgi:hypothetical protein
MSTEFQQENLKERGYLEDVGGKKIILKYIVKNWSMRVWTR